MLTDYIFGLFIEVMEAAKEGRFCHGNAGQWIILDKNGKMIEIDTNEGVVNRELNTPEQNPARVCMDTYDNISSMLMTSKTEEAYTTVCSGPEYRKVMATLIEMIEDGRLKHTNGGIWTGVAKYHPGLIVSYTVSVRGQITFSQRSLAASWQYNRNYPHFISVDQETVNYLKYMY
jgi:hypothetical protein